jgi:hypothetical protein
MRGASLEVDPDSEDNPPTEDVPSLGGDVIEVVSEAGARWAATKVAEVEGFPFPTFSLICDVPEYTCDDEDAILSISTTSDESAPKDGNWDHWFRLPSHMLVSLVGDDREEYEEGALLLSLPLLFSLGSELLLEFVQPFKKFESKSVFQPPKSIASVVAAWCFVLI